MSDHLLPDAQRLSRRVAAQLSCSRSEAENYILGGWVRVDGVLLEEPMARVRTDQVVEVHPQARPEPLTPVTLIWHKPANRVLPQEPLLPDALAAKWFKADLRCASDRTGLRMLKAHLHRLQPVAPLAHTASGLMVYTQNPAVARKLNDTAHPVEHEWLVEVADAAVLAEQAGRDAVLQSLSQALFFNGWALPKAQASWQSEQRLRLAIKGDCPGQVEHLVMRAGLKPKAVRRLRLGRVALAGLAVGEWRYLLPTVRF